MNLKLKTVASVIALAAVAFAAENIPATAPAADAAVVAPAAPAAPAAETAASAPVETAPVVAPAPVEAAPAEVAAPAADEPAAPMAVRGGEAPEEQAPVAEAPAAPVAESPKPVVKYVYQPVYTSEPTAVRSENQVRTVYVAEVSSGPDTVSFDELRGLVPMKTLFGIQAFVGSYLLDAGNANTDDFEDYTGMTWRAGIFGIFPLNEYTIGLKIAALYEQSDASASSAYYDSKAKFKQSKVDVPVLFSFKPARSGFMFDLGTQVSIPVKDEFKVTRESKNSKLDMLDKDFRSSLDWSIVCGFAIRANKYVGLDFRFDVGISHLYDTDNGDAMKFFSVDELTSASFLMGLSFYVL